MDFLIKEIRTNKHKYMENNTTFQLLFGVIIDILDISRIIIIIYYTFLLLCIFMTYINLVINENADFCVMSSAKMLRIVLKILIYYLL